MKVLGLTCGRRLSNTEILVKEALMGAEEMGVEVEIVRLMDLSIKPCTRVQRLRNQPVRKGYGWRLRH